MVPLIIIAALVLTLRSESSANKFGLVRGLKSSSINSLAHFHVLPGPTLLPPSPKKSSELPVKTPAGGVSDYLTALRRRYETEPINILAQQAKNDPLALAVYQDRQYLLFHKSLDKAVLIGPTMEQQQQGLLSFAFGGADAFGNTASGVDPGLGAGGTSGQSGQPQRFF